MEGLKTKTTDYKPKNEEKIVVSDNEVRISLGKNKYVSVRKFNGKQIVDIREYYEKDRELLPGKKGIALTLDLWAALKANIDNIDEALANNK